MPLNRLKKKTSKEILWIYILRLLIERELYAYELKKELGERFGIDPALVTSYVVLYRLEKGRYVTSRWDKNKKYYTITKTGRDLFDDGVKYLENLVEKLVL
ncbi:MAG: PadR family transcriptional regulator [Candidatus Hydrothermarchaeales archaeon]